MDKEAFKATLPGQILVMAKRIFQQPEYRQWLQDYDHCHTMFKIEELGPLNSGRILYVMNCLGKAGGLFWGWKNVCWGLRVVDRFGFTPVVDWTKSPYYVECGYQGRMEPFEYYFEPLSQVSYAEAMQSKNVVFYNKHTDGGVFALYRDQNEDELSEMARINAKYVHIRSELYSELYKEIRILLKGKKTLAVHVRGVEWGNIAGHPIPVALEEYARRIDTALAYHGFEQIFLATDSEDTVTFFKDRYGDRSLVYYDDVVRSKAGSHVLVIHDKTIQRENNGYLLGREVLKDMLTLSFCDGIVAGISHISYAAEVFKKSRNENYQYKSSVDQRLCKQGISPHQLVDQVNGEQACQSKVKNPSK